MPAPRGTAAAHRVLIGATAALLVVAGLVKVPERSTGRWRGEGDAIALVFPVGALQALDPGTVVELDGGREVTVQEVRPPLARGAAEALIGEDLELSGEAFALAVASRPADGPVTGRGDAVAFLGERSVLRMLLPRKPGS